MKQYKIECLFRDRTMIEETRHADIYHDYWDDYITAENEEEALDFAIDSLYYNIIDNNRIYCLDYNVIIGDDLDNINIMIYDKNNIPVGEYYSFKVKLIEEDEIEENDVILFY